MMEQKRNTNKSLVCFASLCFVFLWHLFFLIEVPLFMFADACVLRINVICSKKKQKQKKQTKIETKIETKMESQTRLHQNIFGIS